MRRRIIWAFAVALLLAVGSVAGLYVHFSRILPSATRVREMRFAETSYLYDTHGKVISRIYTERRTIVPLSQIPRVMILSVLAAEDADFYIHRGLDIPGIFRAMLRSVTRIGRAKEGASTITQQVVKNILLSPERTLSRKVKELILARRLEQELTKNEILELYLNLINFGHGRYGVEEASQFYFSKPASQLTLSEASILAGIPKSPQKLSPITHFQAAIDRQMFVLGQLLAKRQDYWPDLSLIEIADARSKPPKLNVKTEEADPAPEVTQWVKDWLKKRYGLEAYRLGGLHVHLTLDSDVQRATREAVQRGLRKLDERLGVAQRRNYRQRNQGDLRLGRTYEAKVIGHENKSILVEVQGAMVSVPSRFWYRYNPKEIPLEQWLPVGSTVPVSLDQLSAKTSTTPSIARLEMGPEAAVIVLDVATRNLIAMVGGFDATAGFNRAMYAIRQPGSSFKPIVYGEGMRSRRFTPATLVLDAPEQFGSWRPDAGKENFLGWIRVRKALAESINMAAVRLALEIGPTQIANFARTLGIVSPLEATLPIALGASGVAPVEMVQAFSVFASGGVAAPYQMVKRVLRHSTEVLYEAPRLQGTTVMSSAEAFMVTSLMTSVVREGTGKAALALKRPCAGKTGTSNDSRDVWFVGYTPQRVAAVWLGYDDRRSLGKHATGGRDAVPIWVDVMKAATHGLPPIDFSVPPGVFTVAIDPNTGMAATNATVGAIEEYFLDGTGPNVSPPPADPIQDTTGQTEPSTANPHDSPSQNSKPDDEARFE